VWSSQGGRAAPRFSGRLRTSSRFQVHSRHHHRPARPAGTSGVAPTARPWNAQNRSPSADGYRPQSTGDAAVDVEPTWVCPSSRNASLPPSSCTRKKERISKRSSNAVAYGQAVSDQARSGGPSTAPAERREETGPPRPELRGKRTRQGCFEPDHRSENNPGGGGRALCWGAWDFRRKGGSHSAQAGGSEGPERDRGGSTLIGANCRRGGRRKWKGRWFVAKGPRVSCRRKRGPRRGRDFFFFSRPRRQGAVYKRVHFESEQSGDISLRRTAGKEMELFSSPPPPLYLSCSFL